MKILIFGGTGAMGTPLVELLAGQGHDVYVTSRRKREYETGNIHCVTGNAHEMTFLETVLQEKYAIDEPFSNRFRAGEIFEIFTGDRK